MKLSKDFVGRHNLVWLQAKVAVNFITPNQRIILNVPIPAANLSNLLRQGKTLFPKL